MSRTYLGLVGAPGFEPYDTKNRLRVLCLAKPPFSNPTTKVISSTLVLDGQNEGQNEEAQIVY